MHKGGYAHFADGFWAEEFVDEDGLIIVAEAIADGDFFECVDETAGSLDDGFFSDFLVAWGYKSGLWVDVLS